MSQVPAQGERDRAMSYLHATRKEFLDMTAGRLDAAQWNFKPAGGAAWSLGELAEHLAVTERGVFLSIQKSLTKPATAEEKAAAAGRDERILRGVPDRSRKVQAPESVRPTGRFAAPADAIDEFKKRRDETIRFIEATQTDLRDHVVPHPVLGPMDAYQWVLFLAAHCDRHIQQMREVTVDPDFPAAAASAR